MFEQHIPEKNIQERSGHRSLDVLGVYEKTTNQQKIAASRVVTTCMSSTSGTVEKHEKLTDYEKRSREEHEKLMEKRSSEEHEEKPTGRQMSLELPEKPDPKMFHGCCFSNCTFSFKN